MVWESDKKSKLRGRNLENTSEEKKYFRSWMWMVLKKEFGNKN